MKHLNIGLLGYGLAGSVFHAPLIQACPDTTLTAIGSRSFDEKSVPSGVRADSFDAVINAKDIDLIVVATTNNVHVEQAAAALRAGKDVVVDKPMAIRLSEVNMILDLAAQHGRKITVFQNRRWDGGMLTAKQVHDQGTLGRVSLATFHYDRFVPDIKARWREEPAPGAGVLYDLGPHLIDQAYHLFGLPLSVTADVTAQRDGARVPDYFHLVLEYPDKRVICRASSLVYDHGPRIAIYGDKGGFQHFGLDTQEDALKAGKLPGNADWGNMDNARAVMLAADGSDSTEIPSLLGAYECFYQCVADAILQDKPMPVTPAEIRDAFAILEAAVISGKERRTVAVL